jgi:hypothetical protein
MEGHMVYERIGGSMEADARIVWLRVSYRVGAVADGIAALLMLMPTFMGIIMGAPDTGPPRGYTYAMGMGGSLMLGWAFLLLWADRKPVERKGVLLITLIPVFTGIALPGLFAIVSGFAVAVLMIGVWIIEIAISCLFVWAYYNAASLEHE